MLTYDPSVPVAIMGYLVLGDGTRLPIPTDWIQVTMPRTVNISAKVLDWVSSMDANAKIELTYAVK
jgi:hypothetical protein